MMSRVNHSDLQQVQFQLLRDYASIEQKLRSWCPGANWRDVEIAVLKKELEQRNEAERAFLELLLARRQSRNPANRGEQSIMK